MISVCQAINHPIVALVNKIFEKSCLVVTLPRDAAQEQEEGVVHPESPVLRSHLSIPGWGHPVRQLGFVDVGHGRMGDCEGQSEKLKKVQRIKNLSKFI